MSLTETTGPLRGTLTYTDNNEIVNRGVKASTTITVGDPISFDANGFAFVAINTSSFSDGFGMALEAADNGSGADGDISVQVAVGNTYVNMRMGGAVPTFQLVSVAADSDLVALVIAAIADVNLQFGRYMGHPKEEKAPTNAVDTDIGVIRIGL